MTTSPKPNLIIFFTDQQRWDTLGLNGCPLGLTPNLDRLARSGTFFKEATTPQPVCGPARSCLQTGQYATTTGVWHNGPGLKKDAATLAGRFREGGYRTGYIGKWHLSEAGHEAVPEENRGGYQDWLAANVVELTSGPYSLQLWNERNEAVQLPGYRVDAQTDAAIRYVHERSKSPEEPYLLCLSFLEPHHQNTDDSYPAPHGLEEAYRGGWMPPDLQALGGTAAQHWAGYCGMVKRLDDALGRLVDAVESLGQADNTVFAFVSDHGCHFKTRNGEYKRSPHETSLRIPFVLWGGPWNGGGEKTCPASLVDLMPSLLDTAGLPIPGSVQGRSLLPAAARNDTSGLPAESFSQFGDGGVNPGRVLRTSRWKYAVQAGDEYKRSGWAPEYTETHLYDLRTDPYELANLVAEPAHEALRASLRERLLARMAEIGEEPADILPAGLDRGFTQRTVDYPNEARLAETDKKGLQR